jgi:hypothetical protein
MLLFLYKYYCEPKKVLIKLKKGEKIPDGYKPGRVLK